MCVCVYGFWRHVNLLTCVISYRFEWKELSLELSLGRFHFSTFFCNISNNNTSCRVKLDRIHLPCVFDSQHLSRTNTRASQCLMYFLNQHLPNFRNCEVLPRTSTSCRFVAQKSIAAMFMYSCVKVDAIHLLHKKYSSAATHLNLIQIDSPSI